MFWLWIGDLITSNLRNNPNVTPNWYWIVINYAHCKSFQLRNWYDEEK